MGRTHRNAWAVGLVVLLSSAGCKSGSTWNWSPKQLFGSTTVPPPATGQYGGAASPYYQGAPPAAAPAAPAGNDPYAPQGGFRSGDARGVEPAARLVRVTPGGPVAANRDDAVPLEEYAGRIRQEPTWNDRVQQRGVDDPYRGAGDERRNNVRIVGETTAGGPDPVQRAFASASVRDQTGAPSAAVGQRSSIRLASAQSPRSAGGAPPAADAAPRRQAPFGNARDYSWLKGQLEPSADGRGWQLRYLPQGNRVDQYGGVMPLTATTVLEGYQQGDYIAVQGSVEHVDDGAGGFLPRYNLERVKRLEQ